MPEPTHAAGEWVDETVAGVPCRRFAPENPQPGGVVWLADFDGLSPEDSPAWTGELANRGVAVLRPLAGPTWWLDRPDPGFRGGDPDGMTAWRWVRDELAPAAADVFGGPACWAGAGAGGAAAVRAGFAMRNVPAVWALAPAVSLEAVYGRGSTLDGLFDSAESARTAGVLTAVRALARPRRLRLVCDPGEVWFPGCELLADKLASGGVPHEVEFSNVGADRAAALDAAGREAARFLADALTFVV